MPSQQRSRVGVILTLGALWLSAIAAPASAAGTVRWVDNDSSPGDGPAKCDTAPFHTIQAAINSSNPYDTIYVCPGTYRQALNVDVKGLHIESINYRKAKILPPSSYGANFPALVSITARDVDFWNFLIPIAGGPGQIIPPSVNGGGGGNPSCETTIAAIEVLRPNADIRGNYIKGTGDFTYSGECGYLYGIVIASAMSPAVNPDVTGPNVGSVSHNRILDFKYAGILIAGDVVKARIVRNAVRFVHENDPATCVLAPVLGVNAELTFPCQFDRVVETGNLNGVMSSAAGILAESSLVEIRNNTVYSTFDISLGFPCTVGIACVEGGFPPPFPTPHVFLSGGIVTFDTMDGSAIRNNTVAATGIGIGVMEDSIPVPGVEPGDNPDGSKITGNRVHDSLYGYLVLGDDSVYYGNRARTNGVGALVPSGVNNLFQANDFRFNHEADCVDLTTGGTGDWGTDNWWTNEAEERYNFGEYNDPQEICLPTLNPF